MNLLEKLSFLTLAGLLCAAPACIIDATDDDDGAESGNATGQVTTGQPATDDGQTGGQEDTAAQDTGNADGSGSGGAGGACGWGVTGDTGVEEGYVCGGDGADPNGMFPMGCPEGVTLEVGGECGTIEGPGCCDAEGNVWYCGDSGSGPALAQIACS